MSRPTHITISPNALLHNLARLKHLAHGKKIIAMVKANAYGCGLSKIAPVLDGHVEALGVAALEEALTIRALGVSTSCLLFQGIFSPEELHIISQYQFITVIHQQHQLEWLVNTSLAKPISIWIKVNTGMNRLGFEPQALPSIMERIKQCPWVNKDVGLMTHLASADTPDSEINTQQMARFDTIDLSGIQQRSIANSAAILSFPNTHADAVRAGIMLYGVSPFPEQTGADLGLKPVMHFVSAVSALYEKPALAPIGYGGAWTTKKPSLIGIVPVGYGDGYPRHIVEGTPVWIAGREVPIVGRVSMDMMAVDLTENPSVQIGDRVELWGTHIAVERIAKAAGTIAYELLCQVTERTR